jgi:hypothetical protein
MEIRMTGVSRGWARAGMARRVKQIAWAIGRRKGLPHWGIGDWGLGAGWVAGGSACPTPWLVEAFATLFGRRGNLFPSLVALQLFELALNYAIVRIDFQSFLEVLDRGRIVEFARIGIAKGRITVLGLWIELQV